MTFENNNTFSYDATASEIRVGLSEGPELVIPLDMATDFVMCVIAARKVGYAEKRAANLVANAARKSERAIRKANREKARKAAAKSRVAILKKKLAAAEKAAGNTPRKSKASASA